MNHSTGSTPIGKPALNFVAPILTLLLIVLVCLRAGTFWAHEPLLGYANNYDQMRALSALGLTPKNSIADRFQSTPTAPFRWFENGQSRNYNYPSSDILLSDIYYSIGGLIDRSTVVDIKHKGLVLLLFWGAGIVWCTIRLLQSKPWWAVVFAGWLLLVVDPINLLFLNTFYAEFSAFAAVTGLIGLFATVLAQMRFSGGHVCVGLTLLALLATNRQQYIFLPIVTLPMLWYCCPYVRSRSRLLAGLLVMVAPLLLYSADNQFPELRGNANANRVDTVMAAMLPAATAPRKMLQRLGMPESCMSFIGLDWYHTDTEALRAQCPEALTVSRFRYIPALALDPMALPRMLKQALLTLRQFIRPILGLVEGQEIHGSDNLPAPAGWTIDILFNACPDVLWLTLTSVLLVAPLALGLWAWRLKRHDWALTLYFLAALQGYCIFASLLGDGYAEFARHAILTFTLGLLSLLILASAPWLISEWRKAPADGKKPV